MKSNCCDKEVGINEGASVTHFYICKGCGNACDVHDEPETKKSNSVLTINGEHTIPKRLIIERISELEKGE